MNKHVTWEIALERLKAGNQRFRTQNLENHAHDLSLMESLKEGQAPYAIIIGCADSRFSADIIFDEALGNIFVIQNAGNVIDDTVLGSIEYAVDNLHSPLILVLGHSQCGAVTAALDGMVTETKLNTILERIKPWINPEADLEKNIKHNAEAMANIIRNSKTIQRDHVKVMSAYYDIGDGSIEWQD